jgi:phospholipase C
MFLQFLATRQAYALRRAIRRNGELSMFEQQQPFANLKRMMASLLTRMTASLLTVTIALGPSVTLAFASSAKPVTKASSATATPIQHLIVIFQENVSFDHYFGTYPNAQNPKGEPKFKAASNTPTVNGLTNALLNNNPNLNPANGAGASNPFRLDRSKRSRPTRTTTTPRKNRHSMLV